MQKFLVAGMVVAVALVAMPATSIAQTPAESFEGKPEYKEGKALGYFVWRDGDTWKLRWMTFGAAHKFSGRILVEGGEIKSFKRIDVDKEREVIRPGHRGTVVRGPRGRVIGGTPGRAPVVKETTQDKIEQQNETIVVWQTSTNDDIDGVDVKVSDATTGIRFNLLIDGQPHPKEVEVGKNNVKPGVNPVRVLLKP